MACELGMILNKTDSGGAYTQSVEVHRRIFVKPSFRSKADELIRLLKTTSCGIVSAGRKWQGKSHGIVNDKLGMKING